MSYDFFGATKRKQKADEEARKKLGQAVYIKTRARSHMLQEDMKQRLANLTNYFTSKENADAER